MVLTSFKSLWQAPFPARRAGRYSPAARRQRNPQGRGRDGPRRADVSPGIEAAARRGTARPRPGGGRQDTHQAPGQPPHHPRDAAVTDPPNETRAAAHAAPPTGGAIQIVAPARPGHRHAPSRRDGATGGGGGANTPPERSTRRTRRSTTPAKTPPKGGSRRHLLCVRPLIKGWCGGRR